MHKCTSYGPDKLFFYHFDLYLTPVTLAFNLLKICFKQHFSSSRATTVTNCFEIHELWYKLWTGQIRTDARTHAHTPNKNCNNYVSLTRKRARQKTMPRYMRHTLCNAIAEIGMILRSKSSVPNVWMERLVICFLLLSFSVIII